MNPISAPLKPTAIAIGPRLGEDPGKHPSQHQLAHLPQGPLRSNFAQSAAAFKADAAKFMVSR